MSYRHARSGGLGCNDDLATGVIQSEIVLPVTSGSRVLLFVDGLLGTSVGSFVLTVTLE